MSIKDMMRALIPLGVKRTVPPRQDFLVQSGLLIMLRVSNPERYHAGRVSNYGFTSIKRLVERTTTELSSFLTAPVANVVKGGVCNA